MTYSSSLVWFRRDLRSSDHAALHAALHGSDKVYCVFLFDTDILEPLRSLGQYCDRRVEFIHGSVQELATSLQQLGGGLIVRHGRAADEIPALAQQLNIQAVFANRDYEPDAIKRDSDIAALLKQRDIDMVLSKDQTIFDGDEVLSQSGKPLSVFTPYKNAWLKKIAADTTRFFVKPYPIDRYADRLRPSPRNIGHALPTLAQLGFAQSNLSELGIKPGMEAANALAKDFFSRIGKYHVARDFPAVKGPSYLSVHLRFGTISIRTLARRAIEALHGEAVDARGAEVWLSELIWRDFYFMILQHHPHVATHAFKPEYDRIAFETGKAAEVLFDAWCEGRTGFPLIDAAMLQLNQTGYMHNRLRMVTASFLIKDMGIHWRRGEAYFAQLLNDFDLSANNGGWQWAASSGCDAQPFFRIFNPLLQSQKFDPEGKFIKRYLPQLGKLDSRWIHAPWTAPAEVLEQADVRLGDNYPRPILAHDEARRKTLARYDVVKKISSRKSPPD